MPEYKIQLNVCTSNKQQKKTVDLKIHQCKIELLRNKIIRRYVPGTSVRNSACGKGHEEGGSANAKAGWSLRSPPGNSRAPTPKTRVCLLYCFVLSPTPLTLRGLSPTTISFSEKRVNLQLQLINFLGVTRVFQPTNSFGSPLACLNRFFRPRDCSEPPNCERHEMF